MRNMRPLLERTTIQSTSNALSFSRPRERVRERGKLSLIPLTGRNLDLNIKKRKSHDTLTSLQSYFFKIPSR